MSLTRAPIATMASGAEVALYLHTLVGSAGDGPTVGICAAIHGNERTSTEIVLEASRAFSGLDFKGRLMLAPVANPLAFEANHRHTPTDEINLNRVFPGQSGGWFSEQLALVLSREFLDKIDVLIDIHSGGDRPTVDYVYIRNAERLSRAFGSRVLYRGAPDKQGTLFAGTSVSVTEKRDVPSVTIELGGGLIDQRPYVGRGIRGLTNILATLGMLDREPTPSPDQIVVDSIVTSRPRMGGFLETEAPALGETIGAGACLGRVIHPQTFEELDRIDNQVSNGIMILSHLTRNVVQPGDYGYMVGSISV